MSRPTPSRGLKAFRADQLAAWTMVTPALLACMAFAVYPVLESILLSLQQIYVGVPALGQTFVGARNYVELWQDPAARSALLLTVAFVLSSTMLELVAGLVIALVLHETFRARGWVRAAALIPWAIPTAVASQMWRYIANDQYGLANLLLFGDDLSRYAPWLASPSWAFLVVVLADVWKTSSFAGLLLLAGLQTIPEDLYDAARIDGANLWQRFWHVTVPLLKPALLLALLFRTMDAFRVFDLVFVMTQGGPGDATQVLQFYGYQTLFTEGRVGYGAAVSVTVFAAIFLLSLFYLRVAGAKLLSREAL